MASDAECRIFICVRVLFSFRLRLIHADGGQSRLPERVLAAQASAYVWDVFVCDGMVCGLFSGDRETVYSGRNSEIHCDESDAGKQRLVFLLYSYAVSAVLAGTYRGEKSNVANGGNRRMSDIVLRSRYCSEMGVLDLCISAGIFCRDDLSETTRQNRSLYGKKRALRIQSAASHSIVWGKLSVFSYVQTAGMGVHKLPHSFRVSVSGSCGTADAEAAGLLWSDKVFGEILAVHLCHAGHGNVWAYQHCGTKGADQICAYQLRTYAAACNDRTESGSFFEKKPDAAGAG